MKEHNAEKELWPEDGYTKADLAAYYEAVAQYLLPHLKDRPLVLKRFPDGIHKGSFFHKNVENPPEFVKTVAIPAETVDRTLHYIICDSKETLLYLAHLAAIELHPWNSRLHHLHHPDFMIFDLDPGRGVTFGTVMDIAHFAHELLDELKLHSFPKTSGKRGLHLYVPLEAQYPYDFVRDFAHRFAQEMQKRHPKVVTAERGEEHRHDKVFVDYLRNAVGQTAVAPYSPRAVDGAHVSAPLSWDEIAPHLDPKHFTIKNMPERLKKHGDLFHGVLGHGSDLHKANEALG